MKYKNYELDEFQLNAIKHIDDGCSVVVSAPTGSGKTLIADYIINKYIGSSHRVIYTAPIKALSNQKYLDFSKEYGNLNVGLVTGDTVINSMAQIVVMTTEIYRNMLLTKDPSINDIKFVIFDEIHYMSDIERGTVWEESLIFSPPHIRFLCLSATIPNHKTFADWLIKIKKHDVKVVTHNKRSVPLEFFLYDRDMQRLDKKDIKLMIAKKKSKLKENFKKKQTKSLKEKADENYNHIFSLVKNLNYKNLTPAIFFCFSRKQVEDLANNVSLRIDLLTKNEKNEIDQILFEKQFEEKANLYNIKHYDIVKDYLYRGFGIHHAGLFPLIKEIVEILFSKGLIKVLFATETFAVGINMPAKSVIFISLRKYDGITFRGIQSIEFYQMAGRAGRRGIDKIGNVLILSDDSTDLFALKRVMSKDSEPIISQFKLSYNTILNMIKNHTDDEILILLKSNFDYFQKKSEQNIRIVSSYKSKVQNLIELGFIADVKKSGDDFYIDLDNKSYSLTEKGNFASKIYAHELTITELFFSGFYKNFTNVELNILLSAIVYEERKNDSFEVLKKDKIIYESIINKLRKDEFLYSRINKKSIYKLTSLVNMWSNGCEFSDLTNLTNLQEGDLIRQFKQIIDFCRQIRRATDDFNLADMIDRCRLLIDRDIVNMTI